MALAIEMHDECRGWIGNLPKNTTIKYTIWYYVRFLYVANCNL